MPERNRFRSCTGGEVLPAGGLLPDSLTWPGRRRGVKPGGGRISAAREAQLCDHARMRSEPGDDQLAADATAALPELSRAGQVALVTGGSAGLGLAIATALAYAGSDVVLASRSVARCQDAAARLSARTGRTVRGRACDVTDERAVADPGLLTLSTGDAVSRAW